MDSVLTSAFTPECDRLLQTLPLSLPLMAMHPVLNEEFCRSLAEAALPGVIRLCLVADRDTYEALGRRVYDALSSRYAILKIILPERVLSTSGLVMQLVQDGTPCDAYVAVGSGTINDLCKHAAHVSDKPYIVFPTAPSMNGYTSANASIIVRGMRHSFPARLPAAIACDLDVLSRAPLRLRRAGIGDSLARPTAQVDWLFSHLLMDTPYDARGYSLLALYESQLFAQAEALMQREPDATLTLMRVLLLSGLGMTLAGGSYPASQGEHMIAHTYEMLDGLAGDAQTADPAHPYHGEEIAVTTLYMARLQEHVLRNPAPPALMPDAPCHEPRLKAEAYARKQALIQEKRAQIAERLTTGWEHLRHELMRVALPSPSLEAVLTRAGAPLTPQRLGWNLERFDVAVECARFTRDRFTFLDVVT